MNAILGIAITMGMVFGGYMLAGGKFNIIVKALPFEMMMIGGAAVGAFVEGSGIEGSIPVGLAAVPRVGGGVEEENVHSGGGLTIAHAGAGNAIGGVGPLR